MIRHASSIGVAVVLATVAVTGWARADEAAARARFREGVAFYDKKQFDAALEAFRAAYAEKPSAGIKQNIALSLKALGRSVEAATAFDEALDEGRDKLPPATRSAIENELRELSKSVATVQLRVVDPAGQPIEGATLTVDGVPLPREAVRRPVRLAQGIHTFTAHVDGLADPPSKKLGLLLGQPVDAAFVFSSGSPGGKTSTLNVHPSVAEATVRLDGVEVGRGPWSGKVSPGAHALEVSAPGRRTSRVDVTVPADATVDYPVVLTAEGEAPGVYDHIDRQLPRPKRFYIVAMLGGHGGSYRLSAALDEPPSGTRRGFAGALIGVRGGMKLGRWFALELLGEVGSLGASYRLHPIDVLDSDTSVRHVQLTPMIRLSSAGKLRFTVGTGIGVRSATVEAKLVDAGTRLDKGGQGLGLSWLTDAGVQFDAGPVFLEGAMFFDVHGIAAVRDSVDERLLLSSPGARVGGRLGLGIPF